MCTETYLSGKGQEGAVKGSIWHDLRKLIALFNLIVQLQEDLLTPQHVGQLLLHDPEQHDHSPSLHKLHHFSDKANPV